MSSSTKTTQECWLCLRLTHLSLNSANISVDSKLPAAITEQQQIRQCNQTATRAGIKTGMSVNHALMLDPQLTLLERNPQAEAKKQQDLGYWAYRFTSLVSVYNDHCLLLEIGRSIKLFNGLKHILHLINNDLTRFQIAAQYGVARTPKAAHLLSCSDQLCNQQLQEPDMLPDRHLAECFIAALDIETRVIDQLHNCGFETLGDISDIPRAELGQRFGASLLDYLDQLWGRKADPQTGTTPPETFHASADFAEPISNLGWINQQLDRLLHDLQSFTTQRQLICRSFSWRFYHENNRLLHTVTIGLSAKQNKFDTLRELTDLKLAAIKLEWEFSSIELSSSQLVPMQLFNDDLFDPQPDQQQFNQLLDKLTNRLGDSALFRLNIEAEHLPELANGRQHVVEETAATYRVVEHDQQANNQKHQPLWLLETPQRLAQQRLTQNKSQPLYEGPLNLIHGPDRISSHWWAKLQSRDYFIARQRDGRLLWIFFDRASRHWFLHGLFA
ncbi:MAG: DNA polymerase Y family protein [Arenicella sp.]|nr:DNA polymerase Y family protein [Arenicella sp.]